MSRRALLSGALALAACGPHPPKEDAEALRRLEAAAAASFDEKALRRSLDAMAAWHAVHQPALRLRPGLNDAEIDAATAKLPFRLPAELRALYRWRDGAEPGGSFFYYHDFPSLRDSVRSWRRWRFHPSWDGRWFPVFKFQGEAFFVECGASEARALPLRFFFLQDTHHWTAFTSLTKAAETAAAGMKAGAITAKTGAVDWDSARLAPIHARLNPGASYPYHVPTR